MLCGMKRLYLTPEEKASLEAAHHNCENRKEGDRIKAILLRMESDERTSTKWVVYQEGFAN
jgi:hypothetical protein